MIHLIFIIHCHFSRAFCALDWVIYRFFIHSCQACICQTCTWLHFSLCGCGRGLQTGLLPAPVLLSLIGGFIAQRLLFVDCAVHHEHGSVLRLIFLMPADWEEFIQKQSSQMLTVQYEVNVTVPLTVQAQGGHTGGTVEDSVTAWTVCGLFLLFADGGSHLWFLYLYQKIIYERHNHLLLAYILFVTKTYSFLFASTQAWSRSSSSGSYNSSSFVRRDRFFLLRPWELPDTAQKPY